MDSIKCEAFLVAIDLGSLTAAGELLGYTQPGITRMIRSLEEEAGFTLFVRSSKGVVPTANGRTMIPIFREIVRAQKSAEEACSEIRSMLRGVLTIGSYYSVSSMLLPPILKQFEQDYPNIRIKLREGGNQEMAQWMTDKSVDCCFAAKPSPEIMCEWIPVTEDELVVWLPPDHPRSKDKSYPVTALQGEPFIITMPNQDTDIDRLLSKYNVKPDFRLSTADAFTTYCMVEAGLGVSFNQRLIFRKWKGNVAALPFDPPQSVTLGITIPSIREASPAAKKFIEYVKRNTAA